MKLDLARNQLDSIGPQESWSRLPFLAVLYLHENNISNWADFIALGQLPSLRVLTVHSNPGLIARLWPQTDFEPLSGADKQGSPSLRGDSIATAGAATFSLGGDHSMFMRKSMLGDGDEGPDERANHHSLGRGAQHKLESSLRHWHPLLPLISPSADAIGGTRGSSISHRRTFSGTVAAVGPESLMPDYLALAATNAVGDADRDHDGIGTGSGSGNRSQNRLGVSGRGLSHSSLPRGAAPPPAAVAAAASLPASNSRRQAGLGLVSAFASIEAGALLFPGEG